MGGEPAPTKHEINPQGSERLPREEDGPLEGRVRVTPSPRLGTFPKSGALGPEAPRLDPRPAALPAPRPPPLPFGPAPRALQAGLAPLRAGRPQHTRPLRPLRAGEPGGPDGTSSGKGGPQMAWSPQGLPRESSGTT